MRQTAWIGVGIALLIIVLAYQQSLGVSFSTVQAPNGTNPEATAGDTLILQEGSGITITGDSSTDTITFTAAVSGAGAVALDLGNNGTDDSTQITRINTTGDTNGCWTETPADEVLVDYSCNYPTADSADAVADDAIVEADLKAVDSASDEECLTFESTVGDFEWQSCGGSATITVEQDDSLVDGSTTNLDFRDFFSVSSSPAGESNVTLANGTLTEILLKAVDTAGDEECLTFESTLGDFEWEVCGQVFRTIDVTNGTDPVADALEDTLVIAESDGIEVTGDAGTDTITVGIADDSLLEILLDAVDTPSDEECLTYESGAGGDFEWQACGGSATIDVEEDDSSVESSATNLDFGAGFDVTSAPSGEANIALDVTEENLTEHAVWIGNGSGLAAEVLFTDCQAVNQAVTYVTGSHSLGCNTFYSQHAYYMAAPGNLTTSLGFEAIRIPVRVAGTIQDATCRVGTAPTGASILVDVHVNGTTIFTTQSNRVTIPAAGDVDTSGTPDTTTLSDGDYIQWDIDQVGSSTAGADISCTLNVTQALLNSP